MQRMSPSSQRGAKKNENRARAENIRYATLQNLTAADKKRIECPNNAEMESSSVNKQPVNNSPFKMFYILGNTSKHLSWRIEMKA